MLVHVVARPLSDVSHVPSSGLRRLAHTIRDAGATVLEDIAISHGDYRTAVNECASALREQWQHQRPQVVHTVGLVATTAALSVRPAGTSVIATFDERPAPPGAESALAEQVDAVLPLSTAEQERWRYEGIPTLSAGTLALPQPVVDACPVSTEGHVVCLSSGRGLETVVRSMTFWGSARLVLLSTLTDCRRSQVLRLSAELGVRDRIDFRPGLRGDARAEVWNGAALLIADAEGARHGGHVAEAAAYGVPAVAVAQEAHLDQIVAGATGVLVDTRDGVRGLGQAVAGLLRDPLRCRGMGSAALARVQALQDQASSAQRLIALYHEVVTGPQAELSSGSTAPLTDESTRLALEYLPLARQLAHRYAGRGQRTEDLVQVANLGLVRAASRFNPELGTEFHSFAVPTILGELRRHFRDHAWAARVPRGLQEATLRVRRVYDELRAAKGQDATPAEVAEHLGLVEEEVLQAMQARDEAMTSKSLDHPMGEDGEDAFGDLVGELDPDLEYVELREAVRSALLQLPEREREILLMRFYGEHTQSEIAERLGLSQVHVSRLITRTLVALREHVLNDVPLPRSWREGVAADDQMPKREAA